MDTDAKMDNNRTEKESNNQNDVEMTNSDKNGQNQTDNDKDDTQSPTEMYKKQQRAAEHLTPHSITGHLQQLFALLQFSKRRYIDPTPFINKLGLDAAQQQVGS